MTWKLKSWRLLRSSSVSFAASSLKESSFSCTNTLKRSMGWRTLRRRSLRSVVLRWVKRRTVLEVDLPSLQQAHPSLCLPPTQSLLPQPLRPVSQLFKNQSLTRAFLPHPLLVLHLGLQEWMNLLQPLLPKSPRSLWPMLLTPPLRRLKWEQAWMNWTWDQPAWSAWPLKPVQANSIVSSVALMLVTAAT